MEYGLIFTVAAIAFFMDTLVELGRKLLNKLHTKVEETETDKDDILLEQVETLVYNILQPAVEKQIKETVKPKALNDDVNK